MLITNFYFPSLTNGHQTAHSTLAWKASNLVKITQTASATPISRTQLGKRYGILVARCCSSAPSKLKEQILSTIADSNGILREDSRALISSLEKFNPNPDLRLASHLYNGCFESISGSFKGTGKPGEAQKLIEKTVTLGRATFNAFKPTGIEIQLKQTYNHVGIEAEDAYNLIIQFSVSSDGMPPMEGMFINRAVFSVSGSARMDVKFESSAMVPLNPQTDLESWLKLFKDANPTMDEEGSAMVTLPAAKGSLDYIYLDDDMRITRGNRGAIVVVKRLQSKVIHL